MSKSEKIPKEESDKIYNEHLSEKLDEVILTFRQVEIPTLDGFAQAGQILTKMRSYTLRNGTDSETARKMLRLARALSIWNMEYYYDTVSCLGHFEEAIPAFLETAEAILKNPIYDNYVWLAGMTIGQTLKWDSTKIPEDLLRQFTEKIPKEKAPSRRSELLEVASMAKLKLV